MSIKKNFINQNIDESFETYVKPAVDVNSTYYRIFDNNSDDDRVVINGKLDKIVNLPKNFNNLLNIDIACGNIVHIPMLNNIYIEYLDVKEVIDIKNLSAFTQTQNFSSDDVKFLSVKYTKNIIYQDIIIQTNKNIIIIQLYKLMIPIDDITHGAVIIFQSESNNSNQSNTIYYTKANPSLIIDSLTNTKKIIDANKKIQVFTCDF
jgi:hypothetical protein